MSKAKGQKGDARREERRRAQLAAMQQRAAASAPPARREHVEPVDITRRESEYEPFLFAIESGLVEYYHEHDNLPIDADAERALRLLITRFEGDSGRHTGSADVDGLADRASRNIDLYFRRNPLLSRAEIIGCLRRLIDSIHTWHTPENPRAYFGFVEEFVSNAVQSAAAGAAAQRRPSSIWVPGQSAPTDEDEQEPAPRRPGGLWVPGDPV